MIRKIYKKYYANMPILNEDDKIESSVKVSSRSKSVIMFKDNKSPGNDGVTAEFYKQFLGGNV